MEPWEVEYLFENTKREHNGLSNRQLALDFPGAKRCIQELIKEKKKKLKEIYPQRAVLERIVFKNHRNYTKQQVALEVLAGLFIDTPAEKLVGEIKNLLNILWHIDNAKKLGTGQDFVFNLEKAKEVPISDYIKFDKAGFASCIFHNEKTPSMKYYPKDNHVHCHACGKHADVVDVVRQLYNLNFINAVKLILRV